jgi:hypothetical protein
MSIGKIGFWLAMAPWILIVCACAGLPGFG